MQAMPIPAYSDSISSCARWFLAFLAFSFWVVSSAVLSSGYGSGSSWKRVLSILACAVWFLPQCCLSTFSRKDLCSRFCSAKIFSGKKCGFMYLIFALYLICVHASLELSSPVSFLMLLSCTNVMTRQLLQYAVLLIQIFASFRPLWRQNSVARSHFVLLIHQICNFLPPQQGLVFENARRATNYPPGVAQDLLIAFLKLLLLK